MKLLVKSDDYGITKGVADGIHDAILNGIITSTGLFANMPWALYAAERLNDCPELCLGIDINIVCGKPCADLNKIPNLVNISTGEFIRSTEKYKQQTSLKEDLWPYDECLCEAMAQIKHFIELTGKKPQYLTGHSISKVSKQYFSAIREAAHQFDIPFAPDLLTASKVFTLPGINQKPFSYEDQLKADPEENILTQLEYHKDKDIVLLRGHAGYVDMQLFDYSTYTIIRAKDHQMYTSERIKKWLKEHDVSLISFNDLR